MIRRLTVSRYAKGSPFPQWKGWISERSLPVWNSRLQSCTCSFAYLACFARRTKKNDSAGGLILEMPFGHHNDRFSLSTAFKHSIHLVWTKIESGIEGDYWKVKITLIYHDKSLLSDQLPWRRLTSRYHGSKISRSQQFFLTGTVICIVER